ncbi:hypothetical protein ACH5RR_017664, partial [Cinchona calisaya]
RKKYTPKEERRSAGRKIFRCPDSLTTFYRFLPPRGAPNFDPPRQSTSITEPS